MNYNRANYALRQAEGDPLFQGPAIKRAGSTLPGVAPYNIYRTADSDEKDNYLMIIAREQKQWHALLRVIGRTDLTGNPKYKDANSRWQYVAEIDKMIEDWTSKRGAYEAFHLLAKAGVPASITLNSTQMMNDPHFREQEMLIDLDHPHRGQYRTFGCVQKLSENKLEYQTGPLLGEHNAEIYAKYMDFTHHDLAKLSAEGII
jgi:formyl-CoA transferase/succinyl-CoA--D-citramalate CoA-transferase